jgi:hypothetical protein
MFWFPTSGDSSLLLDWKEITNLQIRFQIRLTYSQNKASFQEYEGRVQVKYSGECSSEVDCASVLVKYFVRLRCTSGRCCD